MLYNDVKINKERKKEKKREREKERKREREKERKREREKEREKERKREREKERKRERKPWDVRTNRNRLRNIFKTNKKNDFCLYNNLLSNFD